MLNKSIKFLIENKLVAVPANTYGREHPDQLFRWILGEHVIHHCSDCLRLSKMEPRTIEDWAAMDTGLPREGKTECSYGCQCLLKPVKGASTGAKSSSKHAFNPKDHPVSKSIGYLGPESEYKKVLKRVSKAIDGVHGDGELNDIKLTNYYDEALGTFIGGRVKLDSGSYDYVGKGINVSPHGTQKHMTLAHEIGHFIDYRGIGQKGKFSSVLDPQLNKWRQAVLESKQYKYLVNLRDSLTNPEQLEYLNYLLDMEELWARSYAQYIAYKSNDQLMLKELENQLKRPNLQQWNKNDFNSILIAFDEIFKLLGWLI